MSNKYLTCNYKYCLHKGKNMSASEAVKDGKKYYHWDCCAMKKQMQEMRITCTGLIDGEVKPPIIAKVLNDLVFKYGKDIDYIQFCLEWYKRQNFKFKSPFSFLYLRKNEYMEELYVNADKIYEVWAEKDRIKMLYEEGKYGDTD